MSISLWFCDSDVFLGFETNWKIWLSSIKLSYEKKVSHFHHYCIISLILRLVCKTEGEAIAGLGSLAEYKGCTEIDGNLLITIRGSGVSGKPYIYCSLTYKYSIINASIGHFTIVGL